MNKWHAALAAVEGTRLEIPTRMEPLVNNESSNTIPSASRKVLKQAKKARKENRITLDIDAMMRFNNPKAREAANKQKKYDAIHRAEDKKV